MKVIDWGSITVCSTDYAINMEMMGGPPPDLGELSLFTHLENFKINCVLGVGNSHILNGIELVNLANKYGIKKINLREPYGQAHIGHRFMPDKLSGHILQDSVPYWLLDGVEVYYWDVHIVAVRSINLYANGRISTDYPITKGHISTGIVQSQDNFEGHQRRQKQWITK